MATQVFHFSNTGVSSGQGFYLKEGQSRILLRNLVLDSNSPISGNNLVYNNGDQSISGNKTFRNSIFYGLASGSIDLGLRTNISSGSGDTVSFTRGGTVPSVHGYGIVFEGGSVANKKGYLTVGATVVPQDYQYASLDWTNRILSGNWRASSPIRVGDAVSVMTTGNQTISGVKTFASRPTVNGTGVLLSGQSPAISDSLVTHIRPSGTNNVFVSSTALASTSIGSQNNIAVGVNALTANVGGDDNVAMGHEALYSNTNGNGNIGIGRDALKNANGPDANICIGTQAGDTIQAGGSNIIIGHEADVDNAGRQRCIVLGRSATSPAIDGSLAIGGTAGNAMANLNVATAGAAAAGEYLNIYINGVQRKIALLLP